MIEVIPLYPCVHTDAYTGILGLLGEEIAHQLLYDPREVYGNDRPDNRTNTETIEGWLRARVPSDADSSIKEEVTEPAAQCP